MIVLIFSTYNIYMMFEYSAYVTKVYDGDTITCTINCGFGIALEKQKLRLSNINAPEMRGDSRQKGVESRNALSKMILHQNIKIQTSRDKKGKYGRYLAIVFINNVNVNEWLVDNGFAKLYK
jgi:micrococcal nuclease